MIAHEGEDIITLFLFHNSLLMLILNCSFFVIFSQMLTLHLPCCIDLITPGQCNEIGVRTVRKKKLGCEVRGRVGGFGGGCEF